MRTLEESYSTGLLVLDENRTVVGMVSDRNVVKAAREGQQTIANIVEKTDLFTVRPETPISELFAPSSTAKVPLTVVDENQRLLGIVPRVALLNSMADPGPATGEIPPVKEEPEPVVVSPSAGETDTENGAAFAEEQTAPTEVSEASASEQAAAEPAARTEPGLATGDAADVERGKH